MPSPRGLTLPRVARRPLEDRPRAGRGAQLDGSVEGRIVQEADGTIVDVQATNGELFGWPLSELAGYSAPIAVHPDDRQTGVRVRERVRTTGTPEAVQLRVRTRSGRWLWIECRFRPCGPIVPANRTIGDLRDVSARYLDEEAMSMLVDVRSSIDVEPSLAGAWQTVLARLSGWALFDRARTWERCPDGFVVAHTASTDCDAGAGTSPALVAGLERVWEGRRWSWIDGEERSTALLLPVVTGDDVIAIIELRSDTGRHDSTSVPLLVEVVARLGETIGRRVADAERLLARRNFELAFTEAAIGMAIVATDGTFLQVNRSFSDLVGRSQQELRALGFQAITHPDDMHADLEYVGQMLAGERTTYRMAKRYLRPDGTEIWGLLSVSLVRDEAGIPLHFIAQIQDIDDRRRAEVGLDDANARFRAVLGAAPTPMAIVRTDPGGLGTIVESNDGFDTLVRELGRPATARHLGEVLDAACAVVGRVSRSGRPAPETSDHRVVAGDGTIRELRITVTPVEGPDGDRREAVVRMDDRTGHQRTDDVPVRDEN